MFPYIIFKTLNDGNEFLANVSSNQKVKILPSNGCKMGKFSEAFSLNSYPNGFYE
jgi:hypothetical protein